MPRHRDVTPPGYVTVREAAEVIGRSPETVVRYLRAGYLDGLVDQVNESGEPRHYVAKSALKEHLRELARGEQVRSERAREAASVGDDDRHSRAHNDELLQAKDEIISDLRHRVAFLEHQVERLHGSLDSALERIPLQP